MAIEVPILRLGSTLVASIQGALSDEDLLRLQTRILQQVHDIRAAGVVIDVTALDVIDSFGSRMLSEIAGAVRLRGAAIVIVGIQPEIALSMVLLGLDFTDVPTALDLDGGIRLLERIRK